MDNMNCNLESMQKASDVVLKLENGWSNTNRFFVRENMPYAAEDEFV